MKPSQMLDALSSQDCLAVIITAALITHLVFRRTEPSDPSYIAILIFGIPLQLTSLLARRYDSILLGVLVTFSSFWGSLLVSVGIYRLSPWHPLYIYPGPVLARLSKFWLATKARTGKQHIVHQELHKKYGNVVRVGPNEISICDIAAVDGMLGHNGPPKGSWWEGRFSPKEPVKPLIALRDKKEHARRRKPWTRGFGTTALKGYEPTVKERTQQLMDHLAARTEKKDHDNNKEGKDEMKSTAGLDLQLWFSHFSFDLMVDLGFGGGSELMRDGDKEGIWTLVEDAQETALFFSHIPWLGKLFFRLPFAASRLKKYRNFIKERTIKRKETGPKWEDLFYYLSGEDSADGDGKKPTMAEAVSNGALVSLAGSDTTSTVLSSLFFHLFQHPEKYKRLQAEVDSLGEERLKDCAAQVGLPYLTAVLNESLRMYPPVLSGTNRTAVKGMTVGPYYVPEGTSLSIPFYALQRDARYFSLPDQFTPERWLPEDEKMAQKPFIHNPKAFLPFSLGPSNCVGKNFAWIEMRMVVCLLMKRFEMRFKEGYETEEWEAKMQDFFIAKKGELPVVLSLREGATTSV